MKSVAWEVQLHAEAAWQGWSTVKRFHDGDDLERNSLLEVLCSRYGEHRVRLRKVTITEVFETVRSAARRVSLRPGESLAFPALGGEVKITPEDEKMHLCLPSGKHLWVTAWNSWWTSSCPDD